MHTTSGGQRVDIANAIEHTDLHIRHPEPQRRASGIEAAVTVILATLLGAVFCALLGHWLGTQWHRF